MSSAQNQLSTGENRTRVTLSTCESETAVSTTDIPRRKYLPLTVASRSPCVLSRRRVSFSDAVVETADRRAAIMQNDLTCSRRDNGGRAGERETVYDIWQADDAVGRSDDGYENTPRIDNYLENRVSDCTLNKDRDLPENVDETVARDGRVRDSGESDVRSADHVVENAPGRIEYEDGTVSNEDISNSSSYKDYVDSYIGRDECRMRGGCGGGCCRTPRKNSVESSQNHGCCCCGGRFVAEPNESCAPEPIVRCDGGVKAAACTVAVSRCCCLCAQECRRAVCKKAATRCGEVAQTGARSCGGGGCCGGGCRGGCGKPGRICMPSSSRVCSPPARPRSSCGRSPCARPRCPTRSPCPPADHATNGCLSGCGSCHCCDGGRHECGRCELQVPARNIPKPSGICSVSFVLFPLSRPTRHQFSYTVKNFVSRRRSILVSGCCVNDRTKCGADGACCRLKLPMGCECFGGGLDCRRCGRKVYQAEMQIVSGAPYHNICFSCFCCRKPLESLTYQENCGEIYCKQCYVRNFGPQGYGYGAGAGVLQTPL
ncbi:PREDICTED: uncharacterized protein LOC106748258 [Dinoponera quadriceps]|uniref:Uncharacterized protein LOC106748258 n=1 Tax=Dinoponera quadriceps TaxID=609295 RepID=A0A6P3XVS4_DINQU|nr:PREDICTED: uncharacterized protein LOC106748258 [Dinoponera quadriceps]